MLEMKPKLREGVSVTSQDESKVIMRGGYFAPINSTAEAIISLFDGENSLADIVALLSQRYPDVAIEQIEQAVVSFIGDIWVKGLYVANEIDMQMCYELYSVGSFAYVPRFCNLPNLQRMYLAPLFKENGNLTATSFLHAPSSNTLAFVKYETNRTPKAVFLFQRMSCSKTIMFYAAYGESLSEDNLKGVLLAARHATELDPAINLSIEDVLVLERSDSNTPVLNRRNLTLACVLPNEFVGADLNILKRNTIREVVQNE